MSRPVNAPKSNVKATSIPERVLEKYAIAEFMQLIECAVEKPGRKYSKQTVWETLQKVTTELVDETEVERTSRWMDEGLSEEELALYIILLYC